MCRQWRQSLFCMCILYILQYYVVPLVITIYPSDKAGIRLMFLLTTCITVVFFEMKKCIQIKWWILGSILYLILIFLYHPDGIYGIGNTPFVPALISILVIYAGVLVSLIVAVILVKIIRILQKKSR